MKFQTSKSEKKYNIFNISCHNILTTQVGWSCFQTYAVKAQNRRLEQDEIKFNEGVFI